MSSRKLGDKIIRIVNHLWANRLIRFLFVGGINTLFGYIVFASLILLQIHYSIASLLSTILGILFNFFTTGRIVFNNDNPKLLFRFFGVYGITYLFNLLFLRIFDTCKVNLLIAGILLILPSSFLSYTLNKSFVFIENR